MRRPKVLISQKIFAEAVTLVKEDFEVQENQTDTPLPADELIQMKNIIEAARNCSECGDCLPRCPYQLPIPDLIKESVAWFDSWKNQQKGENKS